MPGLLKKILTIRVKIILHRISLKKYSKLKAQRSFQNMRHTGINQSNSHKMLITYKNIMITLQSFKKYFLDTNNKLWINQSLKLTSAGIIRTHQFRLAG